MSVWGWEEDNFLEFVLSLHHSGAGIKLRLSVLVASLLELQIFFLRSFISMTIRKHLRTYNNREARIKIHEIPNGKRECTRRNSYQGFLVSVLFIATHFQSHLHRKHQLQICKLLGLTGERETSYSKEHDQERYK